MIGHHPLDGFKVIDLAQIIAGPTAAMYLGDLGADVIKVEPLTGDESRWMTNSPTDVGLSSNYVSHNRNKRSICIDLASETGRQIVYRLIERTDVIIINALPRVKERLGLTYETLRSINPRLVYGIISAYGSEGPLANRGGFDLALQAYTGLIAARRMPDGTPVIPAVFAADYPASMMLSFGICAALLERERTGSGRKVEVALLDMVLHMQAHDQIRIEGQPEPGVGYSSGLANVYECEDKKWILVVALTNRQWIRLCQAMELEHLATDPLCDTYEKRVEQSAALVLYQILAAVFKTGPRDEWLKRLEAKEVPCAPIVNRDKVLDYPLIRECGSLIDTWHPMLGAIRMIGLPVRLSQTSGAIIRPAPQLGEHTEEVLQEIGYTAEDIQIMRKSNLVR